MTTDLVCLDTRPFSFFVLLSGLIMIHDGLLGVCEIWFRDSN